MHFSKTHISKEHSKDIQILQKNKCVNLLKMCTFPSEKFGRCGSINAGVLDEIGTHTHILTLSIVGPKTIAMLLCLYSIEFHKKAWNYSCSIINQKITFAVT